MREVTKIMIKKYALNKLKYDFMGYTFERTIQLSFHHLIIPRRCCHGFDIGEGFLFCNGAILRQNTSHNYLHLIEHYDLDRFLSITSEMIDENIKGYLDFENLKRINDILCSFEREYCSQVDKNNHYIIKEEYLKRILHK